MDDGSRTTDGSLTIATNSFNMGDLEFIKEVFEKAGGKITIHSDNQIRISKFTIDSFKDLIRPYFIDDLMYKLSD